MAAFAVLFFEEMLLVLLAMQHLRGACASTLHTALVSSQLAPSV